jgi:cyclophilin family peptidyl-prolyl cis-trans isomerase
MMFVNELPEPITLHYNTGEDLVPQGEGPINAKGGELAVKTFPGHVFSYEYGGRVHFEKASEESTVRVLLGGWNEIEVHCMVTAQDETEDLSLRIIPWWSPIGATHFLHLVRLGYYNGVAIHRVVKGFLAQFGISPDGYLRTQFQDKGVKDDPQNDDAPEFRPGMLSFAGSGPDTRSTQVFVVMPGTPQAQLNYFGTNSWETPFGIVDRVEKTAVSKWYAYGDMPPNGKGPDPRMIYDEGYDYLENEFPKLDHIKSCKVIEKQKAYHASAEL